VVKFGHGDADSSGVSVSARATAHGDSLRDHSSDGQAATPEFRWNTKVLLLGGLLVAELAWIAAIAYGALVLVRQFGG
jgi:hypothetical protein